MLRYAWQNAGYDISEPVENFTRVIDVAFSNDIIECAVMTCDHLAFLHCTRFTGILFIKNLKTVETC